MYTSQNGVRRVHVKTYRKNLAYITHARAPFSAAKRNVAGQLEANAVHLLVRRHRPYPMQRHISAQRVPDFLLNPLRNTNPQINQWHDRYRESRSQDTYLADVLFRFIQVFAFAKAITVHGGQVIATVDAAQVPPVVVLRR